MIRFHVMLARTEKIARDRFDVSLKRQGWVIEGTYLLHGEGGYSACALHLIKVDSTEHKDVE